MEQPGLPHHDVHHDVQGQIEQHHNRLEAPKITLRSMSKSDPHLNIPHLLLSQDEHHPSLNRIVSGLFHADSALRTPVPSYPNLQEAEHLAVARNYGYDVHSSAALLEQSQPVLRKSSSAVDWNGAVAEATRKSSKVQPVDWSGVLSDPSAGRKISFSNFNQLPTQQPQQHPDDQGLVMSQVSTRDPGAMQVAHNPSFAQNLAGVSSQHHSAQSNPLEPGHSIQVNRDAKPGVFGNMFRQGFFSKPVVRSEEEQYRYLMALDR